MVAQNSKYHMLIIPSTIFSFSLATLFILDALILFGFFLCSNIKRVIYIPLMPE